MTFRIANRDARPYVVNRLPFKGSNTSGQCWENGLYVVQSYDVEIFIYDPDCGRWFENIDRYSVTTSKHKNQLRPKHPNDAVHMNGVDMYRLTVYGSYREFIKNRLGNTSGDSRI